MTTKDQLTVAPLHGVTFGAVATGVDLKNLNQRQWAEIEDAFYEYGLLVFPGQNLDAAALPVFAGRFGSLVGAGAAGADRAKSITNRRTDESVLTNQDSIWLTRNYPTRYWHTDGTFSSVAPKVCLLSAASVATEGGQTAFADMAAAYDALDQPTRKQLADLSAFHSNLIGTTRVLPSEDQAFFRSLVGDEPEEGYYGLNYSAKCPLRPLVTTHPVTGRLVLLVGRHAFGIPGMTLDGSERLLNELEAFACRPPRIYEHEWQVGDLIVFDNRRLLHRVCPYDETKETRELLNCRVVGDAESDAGLATADSECSAQIQQAELVRLRARNER